MCRGHKRPETETVSAEDAARNVANVREAERRAVEEQQNRDLAEALDQLRDPTPVAADTGRTEPQPDYTPQPDPEHVATDPNLDPEIAAALQNPTVRAVLEQVNQNVEQTTSAYQQQLANAALTASASFVAAFPELAGLQADQLPGAIALINQTDPVRAQAIATHYGRVNGLVEQARQVAAQQQQRHAELSAAQFKQFAVVSDHRFDAMNTHVPAETMKAIKTEAVAMLKEYGLSDADIAREYNSNPLFRSAAGQQIISDAARFRLSQKGLSQHRANPVPHVVRPGSSAERVTRTEEALAEARARLKSSMSAKEAAAYVIARRAAR